MTLGFFLNRSPGLRTFEFEGPGVTPLSSKISVLNLLLEARESNFMVCIGYVRIPHIKEKRLSTSGALHHPIRVDQIEQIRKKQ